MRAKKLFDATDDLTNSRRFIAALIILQTKAPVHYSVLLATEVIWSDARDSDCGDRRHLCLHQPRLFPRAGVRLTAGIPACT